MIYWCVKNCNLEEDNIPESAFCLAVKIQFLFSVSVIQLSRSENLQTTLESDWIRRMSQNDAVAIRELPTVYESQLRLRTDSVALRVATHFPPFQWPFPFCCVLATQNWLATRKYKPSQQTFHLCDFLVVHHRDAVAAIRSGQLY